MEGPLGRLPAELRLMIIELLPLEALAKLRATNKSCWHLAATAEMYKLDARTSNSGLIGWAAAVSDQDLAIKIIQESTSYGGNVNAVEKHGETSTYATPLHYAAAYGHTRVVRELIKLGADVNSWSSGLSWFRGLGMHHLHDEESMKYHFLVDRGRWSPMVVPIINDDVETATLLMERGADAYVVSPSADQAQAVPLQIRPNATVYHLLAASASRDIHRWQAFFEHSKYRSAINAEVYRRYTALHVAIDRENGPALMQLLKADARPDSRPSWADTPLISAIRRAYMPGTTPRRRKAIMSWITALIQAGAMVNPPLPSVDSPLTCAVRCSNNLSKVSRSWNNPGDVIGILLQNNANVNFRGVDQTTILQHLYDLIAAEGRLRPASLNLFQRLIRSGADVNLAPAPGGRSLLFKSMHPTSQDSSLLGILRVLLQAEAKLLPGEVSKAFRAWCSNAKFRKYKLFEFSNANLQQRRINHGWTQAITSANKQLCHDLYGANLVPSNGDRLVHNLVQSHPKKTLDFLGFLNFSHRCRSQDKDRASLLHVTVRKFLDGAITQPLAVRIVKYFIEKGVPLRIRDAHGKLAPDYLDGIDRCAPLRQLLTEAYYEETRKSHPRG